MGRVLAVLFMAVALMVPTAARSTAPTDIRCEAAASAPAQLTTRLNAKRIAMPCRSCRRKACGTDAIGCIASCGTANALLPRPVVPATITASDAGESIPRAHEGIRGPPDPYPPKPIIVS